MKNVLHKVFMGMLFVSIVNQSFAAQLDTPTRNGVIAAANIAYKQAHDSVLTEQAISEARKKDADAGPDRYYHIFALTWEACATGRQAFMEAGGLSVNIDNCQSMNDLLESIYPGYNKGKSLGVKSIIKQIWLFGCEDGRFLYEKKI